MLVFISSDNWCIGKHKRYRFEREAWNMMGNLVISKPQDLKLTHFFVCDGILSVADYNSTRVGVVVVVVVVSLFCNGIT